MDVTRATAAATAKSVPPVLKAESETRQMENPIASSPSAIKQSGFGLPCAKCRLYYPANLDSCPTCHGKERVSAKVEPSAPKVQTAPDAMPDASMLEQEREEFLKQFKSQLFAAHSEVGNAPAMCSCSEHHAAEPEAATICKHCYDKLQERVDVCEAAMHIDLKEAAQIVYDAVWADPSDPNQTYSNAASALLTEVRKRAGVSSLLGPFQPLTH
jgi:hypothetical protein